MVALLSSILTVSMAASPLIGQAPGSSAALTDAARATPRPAAALEQLRGEPAPDWLKDGIPRLEMEEHLKSRQKKTEKITS